jgi:hypothetical protein
MNASGNTMSRAPLRIAWPVRSKAFIVLRSRSKGTEAACTTATRNRSMLPIVHATPPGRPAASPGHYSKRKSGYQCASISIQRKFELCVIAFPSGLWLVTASARGDKSSPYGHRTSSRYVSSFCSGDCLIGSPRRKELPLLFALAEPLRFFDGLRLAVS